MLEVVWLLAGLCLVAGFALSFWAVRRHTSSTASRITRQRMPNVGR
jgi:hypothetical protein